LRNDIDRNYKASRCVSPEAPTKFTPSLEEHVYNGSVRFHTGQFLDADATSEFLATTGVLTCLVVFAWVRTKEDVRALGAHIPCGCILNSCNPLKFWKTGRALEELTVALRGTFGHVPMTQVQVHIVGGHKATDHDGALKDIFKSKRTKQFLSWHVIDAVKSAGVVNIDVSMLNRFPGGDLLQEQRLRDSNQRFCCAALHMETGKVVTHTEESSSRVPAEWWTQDNFCLSCLPIMGRSLRHARESPGVPVCSPQWIAAAALWCWYAPGVMLRILGPILLWAAANSPRMFYSAACILAFIYTYW